MAQSYKKINIIYTGGTWGMLANLEGKLEASQFSNILPFLSEWNIQLETDISYSNSINDIATSKIQYSNIVFSSTKEPIDSSLINQEHWYILSKHIYNNYSKYDGFIIIHGTDTMAYSSSALSFILSGLDKPVIFTGSQKPISVEESDAKANLLSAIKVVQHGDIKEVAIAFGDCVIRGNRAVKVSTEKTNAFSSPSFPLLAKLNPYSYKNENEVITSNTNLSLDKLNSKVGVLWLHPGLCLNEVAKEICQSPYLGVVLAGYGDGHIPHSLVSNDFFKQAIEEGKLIVSLSQCLHHPTLVGRYSISKEAQEKGIISSADTTCEAMIIKLMWVLANCKSINEMSSYLNKNIRGERSI